MLEVAWKIFLSTIALFAIGFEPRSIDAFSHAQSTVRGFSCIDFSCLNNLARGAIAVDYAGSFRCIEWKLGFWRSNSLCC